MTHSVGGYGGPVGGAGAWCPQLEPTFGQLVECLFHRIVLEKESEIWYETYKTLTKHYKTQIPQQGNTVILIGEI